MVSTAHKRRKRSDAIVQVKFAAIEATLHEVKTELTKARERLTAVEQQQEEQQQRERQQRQQMLDINFRQGSFPNYQPPIEPDNVVDLEIESGELDEPELVGAATYTGPQPAGDSCNVHTWAITAATKRTAHMPSIVMALIFSLAFVMLQIVLLAGTMLETSFPRCNINKDCREGEWCSPALFPPFTTSPGVCFDCWSALHLYDARFGNATYETAPDPYELMAVAAGDAWLREGREHCLKSDGLPRKCDHLIDARIRMSGFNFFVLVSVAVFVVAPIADELDEAAVHESFASFRVKDVSSNVRRRLITVTLWLLFRLRCFVLPLFIIAACLGLILSDELTSYNLLLNGFAITFMTTLDEMLESLVIPPIVHEEGLDMAVPFESWCFNRVFGFFLGISLVLTVLEADRLMPLIGNEAKWGSPCSDIREVTSYLAVLVALGASILRPFWRHVAIHHKSLGSVKNCMPQTSRNTAKHFLLTIVDATLSPTLIWYFAKLSTGEYWLLKWQAGDTA